MKHWPIKILHWRVNEQLRSPGAWILRLLFATKTKEIIKKSRLRDQTEREFSKIRITSAHETLFGGLLTNLIRKRRKRIFCVRPWCDKVNVRTVQRCCRFRARWSFPPFDQNRGEWHDVTFFGSKIKMETHVLSVPLYEILTMATILEWSSSTTIPRWQNGKMCVSPSSENRRVRGSARGENSEKARSKEFDLTS